MKLNHTARTFFPKEYLSRKQNFQKAGCAKWPLPSCRKLFRIFGGFERQASPIGRRQFPHGGYRLDAFNFEDDSHGWRFDMDMVIIYSVNWVIGFIIFCYFFFLSF
ncbi:E3 ubiquitin-protein ligase RNF180-like [Sinocyclocheilus grahami]|uniref:E3 ubiquitin-protein ligase RNF180-like n=1 Tax=Sinocyclocheilus grahami TaxID=75366 RepID=UPI0007AD3CE6|nr:PREDICTED: E3 ubiquitin-protein ligase RNF180-like [Sinocyclocheilus grahami]